ncbi:26S proteasome regulatory complex subunit RPN9 [Perkinsela sp. CCAP 1560/4]|nr:26S proteasome regulatory complex subunit RPN9 [Perkinsela sp. CCAP 1560/4]KNH05033.1 26S proteasome regulatory complex subunit RPN9 [Perkinsela sp. CCAP 1560/4]|eukprot:KNH05020.1 26S proteasome regulatory complex subunit RPN9 [Perkinsela sp. CCAP 1560/4]
MDSSSFIGNHSAEKTSLVEAIKRAAESGLWHEATVLLFRIAETRSPSAEYACHLYDEFLRPGAVFMNPLFHASIVLQLFAGIVDGEAVPRVEDAIAAHSGSTAESMEAKFALQCGVALRQIVNTPAGMDTARSTVRDIQIYLETRDSRPMPPLLSVQTNLLRLESSWVSGDFGSVMSAGMNIHAHRGTTWAAHVDCFDQIWTKTALAMLFSPEVIDFGELLQEKTLLTALRQSSPQAYELVVCINEGNTARASEIITNGIDCLQTAADVQVVREKVALASFLRHVRQSPSDKRRFVFTEIAEACQCTPEDVEMLLLKALERGFVTGKIDGRCGSFLVENVQPGHIPLDAVCVLEKGLTNLIASVARCETFLDTQ